MSIGPSARRDKKLAAVFERAGRRWTVHFGAAGYGDFTLHWRLDPRLARQRRAQYIRRHSVREDWRDPTSAGALSRYVLWERPTVAEGIAAFRKKFRRCLD